MPNAIEVSDLHKDYSGEKALDGVSFSVPRGCLFGIIGADGAGKSTLMRICTTLINADTGDARVLDKDVVKEFKTIRTRIGYMPQKFSLYPDLSVEENLKFFADIFGVPKQERNSRMERLLQFSRLEPFKSRRAGNLSGGMKQKLALSCTLVHTPEVLFLDEPTTGVDPVSRKEFWEILRDIRSQGIAILLSTPYMDEAAYCDKLLLIDKGKAVQEGTPEIIVSSYPYKLFSIEGGESTLVWPRGTPLPSGIVSLYPSGGTVHAACENSAMAPEQVFSRIRHFLPSVVSVKQIKPGIEDVFIYELTKSLPAEKTR
jgi:ABC-2 type transport system ATP-binding protein